MPVFILYLLKFSISLSIVWIFYQLLLRRLTFYRLNRWYLLGYSLLSFFIPLINIGSMLNNGASREPSVIRLIPAIGNGTASVLLPTTHPFAAAGWNLLSGVILLGAVLLLIRSAGRWRSLRRLRMRGRRIDSGGVKLYQVDAPIVPFSFGRAIYINQHLHTEKEWSDIILHEYVHVRQNHTLDILLAEGLCILNWYNPFSWLIRHSIRQNLEFIADQQVLENGVDRKGYQYHLLKVIGESAYRLANNFNFSSLKQRIIMMNKIRSTRLHLLKFLFLLPLLAVLLVAFRDRYRGLLSAPTLSVSPAAPPAPVPPAPLSAAPVSFSLAPTNAPPSALNAPPAVPASRLRDTVPDTGANHKGLAGAPTIVKDTSMLNNALFVVDGIQRPNWTKDSISPADTYSIDVLNGEEALRYFGEKGLYGVIAITTKSFRLQHPLYFKGQVTISENAGKGLLYIIDGVETSAVDLKKLNPDNIESIDVLKGDKAVAAYGVKGANGVVLIHFKKKTGMGQPVITMDKLAITMSQPIITMDSPIIKMGQPVITMDTKDGPVTVQADTIKINKPKITITSKPDGN